MHDLNDKKQIFDSGDPSYLLHQPHLVRSRLILGNILPHGCQLKFVLPFFCPDQSFRVFHKI